MDSDDTPPPPSSRSNPATRLPPAPGPRLGAGVLADAYGIAREKMASATPRAPGYRLFWVRGQDVAWIDLPVGGAYAVIGRHTECDAVLGADPSLSLRHLLATTVQLADGVALRLLDLQTAIPFYLADPVPRRSVVACGPVAVRLGEYVVGGVPIEEGAGGLRAPFGALPRAVVTEAAQVPRSVRPASDLSPPADLLIDSQTLSVEPDSLPIPGGPISRITSMPPSVPIDELPRSRAPARVASDLRAPPPIDGAPCARLTLRRGDLTAAVDLTEAELDLGVLVGRAGRCRDDGLHAVLDTNVSRGHLLLLHHHDLFEAFDLCSTQGTFAEGTRVRRFPFPSAGASLTLAVKNPVTMAFHWLRKA